MSEESKKEPKLTTEGQLYVDLKKANKTINLLKNRIKSLESPVKAVESATIQEKGSSNQGQIGESGDKSTKDHTFKPWQAACSTCGEKNPEFKDETKCADCGQKWGSVETARKMDYCPGCAAKTKFAFVSKEARQKFEEMAKA